MPNADKLHATMAKIKETARVGPVFRAACASGTCADCCQRLQDDDQLRYVDDRLVRQECCGWSYDPEGTANA